ncbi:hypothetical protein BX600DRAFT_480298 [Xylariales sp. PMI_506]|nr:hypothetical protein BX600DRAFT_480298 [Xylariales sp. PMI_506]
MSSLDYAAQPNGAAKDDVEMDSYTAEEFGIATQQNISPLSASSPSPRDSISSLRLYLMLPVMMLLSMAYGIFDPFLYGSDVSNAANTQASIYETVGQIELLHWIDLGMSVGSVAVTPVYLKLSQMIHFRLVIAIALVIFAAAVFSRPHEPPRLVGMVGMSWALGLTLGPIIGAAFAQNPHATWRWLPAAKQLATMDLLGIFLHIALVTLPITALTCSGTVWAWKSGSTILIWVLSAITAIAYATQQHFSFFSQPENRIFPIHLLGKGPIGLIALATLLYLPLFFAFTRGYDSIQTAIRLFPFICVLGISAIFSGGLLPIVIVYSMFYVMALLVTMNAETSEAHIMGYEALMGLGLGMMWFQGLAISNAVLRPRDKLYGTALMNISQLTSVEFGLAVAGCIFQNDRYNRLKDTLQAFALDSGELREALAGVASPIWTSSDDDRVVTLAVNMVAEEISRLFYLLVWRPSMSASAL